MAFGIDRYGRPQQNGGAYSQIAAGGRAPSSNAQQSAGQSQGYAGQQAQFGGQQQQASAPPTAPPPAAPHFSANPSTYHGSVSFNAPTYSPYKYNFSQAPQAYQAGQVSQFSAPQQGQINSQQQSLVSGLLQHPQTMSPEIVAMMKEKEKEQQGQMLSQMLGSMGQKFAAQGMSGSGQQMGMQQNAMENMVGQLTGAYRDIDMNAATQNRSDELNALGAAEQYQQGEMGRATQGYQQQLAGQMAQQNLNQAANESQFKLAGLLDQRQQLEAAEQQFGFSANLQAQKAALDAQIANEQMAMQGSQNEFANQLAMFNTNENVRQFNAQQNNQFANGANLNQNQLINLLFGGG